MNNNRQSRERYVWLLQYLSSKYHGLRVSEWTFIMETEVVSLAWMHIFSEPLTTEVFQLTPRLPSPL